MSNEIRVLGISEINWDVAGEMVNGGDVLTVQGPCSYAGCDRTVQARVRLETLNEGYWVFTHDYALHEGIPRANDHAPVPPRLPVLANTFKPQRRAGLLDGLPAPVMFGFPVG